MTLRTLRYILAAMWATMLGAVLYFVPGALEAVVGIAVAVFILLLVVFTVLAFTASNPDMEVF